MPAEKPGPLADKLNHLFHTVKPRNSKGKEYTNEEVALELSRAGSPISASYIWQIRKGKKVKPSLKVMQALARFFGVPVDYFTDDNVSKRLNEQLQILRAEQEARLNQLSTNPETRLMAARADELSPAGRKQVTDLVNLIYELEQKARENKGEVPG